MTIVLVCREALGDVLYQIQAHAHFWLMGALNPLKLKLLSLYPTQKFANTELDFLPSLPKKRR
jgi:hypothetical protein